MWLLLIPMLAQSPAGQSILEAENAREAGIPTLVRATRTGPTALRAQAVRAIGRTENLAHRNALIPLLVDGDPGIRAAAASALAQMRASFAYGLILRVEKDPMVRAALLEAVGRATPIGAAEEALLVNGLREPDARVRVAAARGLEAGVRLNRRTWRPSDTAIAAVRAAFLADSREDFRVLSLLALNALTDRDEATLASGLADASPLVRRLAVIGAQRWVADPSPLVRVDALKFSDDCSRLAAAAMNDPSDHVALVSSGYMQERKCSPALLASIVTSGRKWQHRASALLAMAKADSVQARSLIAPFLARDTVWQARAWAAEAARLVHDTVTLQRLSRDPEPNVAAAAMWSAEDAVRALGSNHAGLLLRAAALLSTSPQKAASIPQVISAFERLTRDAGMTHRDPRIALLGLLDSSDDASARTVLRRSLSDRDPAVAALSAKLLSASTGTTLSPATTVLPVPPIPSAAYIAGLVGATAQITMRGLGTMTLELLPDDAPVTAGIFAQLAESGQYNGLTFHRIVPNFVVQGGSPGADEYDGRTRDFMRDEVGLARNARGTVGISTRGRDTGDGQIYLNLVDNYRLDRDYTVFAHMLQGLDVMDRIQEGDVIERIEIRRRTGPARRRD